MRYLALVFVLACNPAPRDGDGDAPDAGETRSTCAEAALAKSYVGCEYWPVDLDNAVEVMGTPTENSCLPADSIYCRSCSESYATVCG